MENNINQNLEQSPFSIGGFEHAQRVAKMLSMSQLVPKNYQNNIQNTMIALEIANRIGASPLMVMQHLYIIDGRPSWSSTFIIASINSSNRYEPLKFDLKGAGDDLTCVAWTYEKGGEKRIESPLVSMKMAKAEGWLDRHGSKWKTMPELMIRYRAASFFGKLFTPEILMGMQSVEEVIDVASSIVSSKAIEEVTLEELQHLLDASMAELTKSEMNDAKRIIETNDGKSFLKLKKLLTSKIETKAI
jgi:hypothetical protein